MKVLIAGEGGQGIQAIAEILAKAAFKEGKQASYIPNFGVEQRGGVSLAFVKVQEKPVTYPKFEKADLLAVLSARSLPRVKRHFGLKTKVIKGPAIKNGLRSSLPPKVWNVVVLKEINRLGKIVSKRSLVEALEDRFTHQFKLKPELRELDLKALS